MRTRPLERPVAPAPDTDRSTTTTRAPREARGKARLAPWTPAPMTMTSAVSVMVPPLDWEPPVSGRWRDPGRSSGGAAWTDSVEGDAPVAERDPGVVTDHDVIQDVEVQEPSRRDRLGGEVEVLRRGRGVARGVVVDEDDARSVEPDGVPEQLPDPDERRRDVADVDAGHALHDVLGVEAEEPQLLALEPAHLGQQPVGDVPRRADRPAPHRPVGERAAAELECRREAPGLGRPDRGDRRELADAGPAECRDAAVPRQRLLRELDARPATAARPPHDGDQLRRREPPGPAQGEPLTGAL